MQFVPFNDFKDRSYMELAMCTLDEVPREVVNFFQKRQIAPKVDTDATVGLGKTVRVKTVETDDDQYELPEYLEKERDRLVQAAVVQGI